jgi:hypothetical protein
VADRCLDETLHGSDTVKCRLAQSRRGNYLDANSLLHPFVLRLYPPVIDNNIPSSLPVAVGVHKLGMGFGQGTLIVVFEVVFDSLLGVPGTLTDGAIRPNGIILKNQPCTHRTMDLELSEEIKPVGSVHQNRDPELPERRLFVEPWIQSSTNSQKQRSRVTGTPQADHPKCGTMCMSPTPNAEHRER